MILRVASQPRSSTPLASSAARAAGRKRGVLVDQQGFSRVAHRHILALAVHHDMDGHVRVGIALDIDMADAIGMAQYRYAGMVHDVPDKFVAAPRDDQVDELIQGQHLGYIGAGFEQTQPPGGQTGRGGRLDRIGQDAIGARGLAAAFEQDGIAAFEAQGRNLHQGIGA
jgi:hypothetical protein